MAAVKEIDPETEPLRPGFSANLSGATLYDLIQLQCFSGASAVMRVTSTEDVGYLYFRGGSIVHAMSSSNVGEDAALEILSWTSGSFEPCNAGWPDGDSIHASPQALLLRAAQVADESAKSNLVPFRRARAENPPPDSRRVPAAAPPAAAPPAAAPPATPVPATVRIQTAVRLDPNGTLLSSRGSDAPDLAACAALATRLGNLIGDALGLERVRAVEASGAEKTTLIVVESTGNLVAIRAPASADLGSVRERYGV